MSKHHRIGPSRRDLVRGMAGAAMVPPTLTLPRKLGREGQGLSSRTAWTEPAVPSKGFHQIDRNLMVTPDQVFDWNMFKA